MRIIGHLHIIVLPLVLLLTPDHTVPAGKDIHRIVTGVLDSTLMEKIMEFGTDDTSVRIFVEDLQQPFQQTRRNLRIIIHNKKEIPFGSPDTDIVTAGKTQIPAIENNLNIRIDGLKNGGRIFLRSVIHYDDFQILVSTVLVETA